MNVLLITYSFPPAAGVGVLRALSLAKYLPENGIHVEVLTARNAAAVGRDPALLGQVPNSVQIHRTWTLDLPFAVRKFIKKAISRPGKPSNAAASPSVPSRPNPLKRLLGNLLLPDPQVGWLPFALPAARRLIRSRHIDVVIVTVPPFSTVRLVTRLRRASPQLPIVLDFRDEWLTTTINLVSFNNNERARTIARKAESEAVRDATAVVCVTSSAVAELRKRYPAEPSAKFHCLPNGFDTPLRTPALPAIAPATAVLTYIGTVYGSTDPTPVVEAILNLPPDIRARLHLRFIGHIETPALRETLLRLAPTVELIAFLPQAEALRHIDTTTYLLLITHDPINIAAKLYDYLSSGRPILAAVHPTGDVRRTLGLTRAGWSADITDPDALAQPLHRSSQPAPPTSPGLSTRPRGHRRLYPRLHHHPLRCPSTLARRTHGMMKVAVVTGYFPTSTNPWEGRSAYETLRVLASRCHLHVFCPVATYPRLLKPKARTAAAPDLSWSPEGVPTTYIPYPVLPLVSRPLNGLVMSRRLLPHVRRFAPDVILNYMVYPDGYAAARIARTLRIPVVLTAIGSDLNRPSDPLCAALTRQALRQADFVTTVSADLARTAQTLGANPATTTPILNGCDTSIFHPQDRIAARQTLDLDPTSEIVLYVGRLDLRKGLIELIESAAALSPKRPNLHCYIIGKGPDEPLLLQAIARLHAPVTLVPPCSSAHIAQWMAAANLIALPSYNEGCPNVIIEALASGRPVVATNVGGIPELVDQSCGRLIPSHDVPALTQALVEVLEAPWNPETIAANHSRNWNNVADDLFQVLHQASTRVK